MPANTFSTDQTPCTPEPSTCTVGGTYSTRSYSKYRIMYASLPRGRTSRYSNRGHSPRETVTTFSARLALHCVSTLLRPSTRQPSQWPLPNRSVTLACSRGGKEPCQCSESAAAPPHSLQFWGIHIVDADRRVPCDTWEPKRPVHAQFNRCVSPEHYRKAPLISLCRTLTIQSG